MALLFPRLAFPDERVALRERGSDGSTRTLTYRGLAHAAVAHLERLALLRSREALPDDARIGVWASGELEAMVAIVAQLLAGVSTVPINPKIGVRELEHIVQDAGLTHVFVPPGAATTVEHARALGRAPHPLPPIEAAPDAAPVELPRAHTSEADALVLYTSGTTGKPKGARISSRAIAANLDALARAWDWSDADTVVHALPLFHVHGLVLGLLGSLRVGGAFHHVPRFAPDAMAAAVAAEPSAMLFSVPTMIHRLADAADKDQSIGAALRGARLVISGSAGLPLREHRRIEQLAGRGVHERYGLTETLICCAVPARSAPQPGVVGPPLPGVELEVVGEDGAPVPDDDATLGEVVVAGLSLFSGYLNREASEHPARFFTGDLAARRPDGSVRLVGRRSVDLIKTGGYKVGAGEVEACLLEHPEVAEVAVVGAPDDDLGQRIEAFVVVRGAPHADLAAQLVERVAHELSPHKRPRALHFVAELPRNAMGKIQKAKLLSS